MQSAKRFVLVSAAALVAGLAAAGFVYVRAPVAQLRTTFAYRPDAATAIRHAGLKADGAVSLRDVPDYLLVALLFREDKSFFDHHGFDFTEMRTALSDAMFGDARLRGASTVSQQIARTIFLDRSRTLRRKLLEAVYTAKLERYFTKEEILTLYLSNIEWGPGIYGLADASRHFFAKSSSELTLEEAAFLVSIVPNPAMLSRGFEHRRLPHATTSAVEKVIDTWRTVGDRRAEPTRSIALTPREVERGLHLVDMVERLQEPTHAAR